MDFKYEEIQRETHRVTYFLHSVNWYGGVASNFAHDSDDAVLADERHVLWHVPWE